MKLLEYEAKNVIKEAGIPVPAGFLITSADELTPHLGALGEALCSRHRWMSVAGERPGAS